MYHPAADEAGIGPSPVIDEIEALCVLMVELWSLAEDLGSDGRDSASLIRRIIAECEGLVAEKLADAIAAKSNPARCRVSMTLQ